MVKFLFLIKFLLLLMIAIRIIDKPGPNFLIMRKFFLVTFPRPIVTVPQRLDKSKQLLQRLLNKLTKLLHITMKLL